MPVVHANGIDINYEVQGEGEPIVLIPYLAANQACTRSRWPSTPSTSPATAWTCAGPACPASRKASTPRNCWPTTSRR